MHATFISPIGGVVYFRQTGSEPTVVHGKLYFVNEMTATSVEWAIYDDLVRLLLTDIVTGFAKKGRLPFTILIFTKFYHKSVLPASTYKYKFL